MGRRMARRGREIFVVVVVELLLALVWFYLSQIGGTQPDRVPDDFQSGLGSTMGMVMGAVLGLGLLMYLLAARNDRS